MEEQLSSLAVTHLLQHTLRSLCIHENSQWVYAVFWRILPRNYPPPKWDCQGGAYDRSRGNRRNWILVWEDGFCNFAASSSSSAAAADHQINNINGGDHECPSSSASHVYIGNSCDYNNNNHQLGGLQPELFFKMSHEIYNYGEGLIGKVAADHSHKWIYKEPNNQEINFLSAWHNSADSHPRTWEAQFQSGIKTIALIAVREGVIQLGSVQKVIEDLSYVVLLRKKFSYIESIPGVLLPHPSSSSTSAAYHPFIKIDGGYPVGVGGGGGGEGWHHFHHGSNLLPPQPVPPPPPEFYDHHNNYHHHHQVPMKITPSMSSLEALLSKLPSVVVPTSSSSPAPPVAAAAYQEAQQHHPHYVMMGMDQKVVAKEEFDQEDQDQEIDDDQKKNGDQDQDHDHQSSSRVSSYNHHHHHHHPHPHFVSQESMHSHGY